MSTSKHIASMPEPDETLPSIRQTVVALKANVEVLTQQRKGAAILASAVTWQDLLDLGLIAADQLPR